MSTYLVFSDAHCTPGEDISRFDWLGMLIVTHRPDFIVQLGDYFTMNSLSHWDKNKLLLMEKRRFVEDIKIGTTALANMLTPLIKLQDRQRKNKEKIYKPEFIWCEGNHENWVEQYVETHPEVHEFINPCFHYVKDYLFTVSENIHYVPFKSFFQVNNISFVHAPVQANGSLISGKYVNERALDLFHSHVVYGHTHRFLHSHRFLHGQGLKQAINAGCFFEKTPDYAIGAANEHFRCVLMLKTRIDGLLDIETLRWPTAL